ncbi:DUF3431 domain-containing protein [Sulfuricurvum sp. RIFCSPLOWO2_12_FULL_43_24]|uniref:DUF3431 domain-containing protein n=1 Tax=Sulfuricurvum sp. RIFCSPLOWO2_12_FULL_43_24 TaxID=1802247 RepID=UPI0025F3FD86|nr:DUF3431 domain-containing protein [Sulfuricurvum sp. RIFCSPLOWO2_12_FULL_43_24]
MQKTDSFFIISNHNLDPRHLLDYCSDYLIYDQSQQAEYKEMLVGTKFVNARHTGHNISDYFTFFIHHYDNLPETMILIKGNIFPRHLSQAFFERVYTKKTYTFLFEDKHCRNSQSYSHFLFSENQYLEINNSWYVKDYPHWYFQSFNELLQFFYKDPVLPRYNLFAPGACYIISKQQIQNYSAEFYKNLYKIMCYTVPVNPFPSEAHQIERLCHLIYSSTYEVQEYMNSEEAFDRALRLHCRNRKIGAKILRSFDCAKIPNSVLIIGVHEWDELNVWQERYPNAEIVGAGILPLYGYKLDSLSYLYGPISDLERKIDELKIGFDLIIYEGYHLKQESDILGVIIKKYLHIAGVCFVSDILTLPYVYMRKLEASATDCTISYKVQKNNREERLYLLKITKKRFLFKKLFIPFYNALQRIASTIHWGRYNGIEYLKRKLPV